MTDVDRAIDGVARSRRPPGRSLPRRRPARGGLLLSGRCADGPLRVFELLHDARPVLLSLGETGGFGVTPWADRVRLID